MYRQVTCNVVRPLGSYHDLSDQQQEFYGANNPSAPVCYASNSGESIYATDEFRMFHFKIKQCKRNRSHDWTECPFAHPGEKAQRREPRKYLAIACAEFRNGGTCRRGESCVFAHGVFEYWLHPAKYRTRACTQAGFCKRKVCFFAHSPEQLRPETKYRCHYVIREVVPGGSSTGEGDGGVGGDGSNQAAISISTKQQQIETASNSMQEQPVMRKSNYYENECFEFVKRLKELKLKEGEEGGERRFGGLEIPVSDLPHIDWIYDLVN